MHASSQGRPPAYRRRIPVPLYLLFLSLSLSLLTPFSRSGLLRGGRSPPSPARRNKQINHRRHTEREPASSAAADQIVEPLCHSGYSLGLLVKVATSVTHCNCRRKTRWSCARDGAGILRGSCIWYTSGTRARNAVARLQGTRLCESGKLEGVLA